MDSIVDAISKLDDTVCFGGLCVDTSVVMIAACLVFYFIWGTITETVFPEGHGFRKVIAYPFSMTHILICLIGCSLRFRNWDPNLSWCETYEAPYNNWDVLLIIQSGAYFFMDMFYVSRDPNYYVHHTMCMVGYIVLVFFYPVPLKITILGMFFAEIGGFLLSLRKLDSQFVFTIFLILYGATRAGMVTVFTSYSYCVGLFSGVLPDLPHLIFCICGLAICAQNCVWFNIQRGKYVTKYYTPKKSVEPTKKPVTMKPKVD